MALQILTLKLVNQSERVQKTKQMADNQTNIIVHSWSLKFGLKPETISAMDLKPSLQGKRVNMFFRLFSLSLARAKVFFENQNKRNEK